MFASFLRVLVVEDKKGTKPRPDGTFAQWQVARCVLAKDQKFAEVVTVGALRVPKSLEGQVKQGDYTASFSLGVPDWGDNKGDIIAMLAGLTPIPQGKGA